MIPRRTARGFEIGVKPRDALNGGFGCVPITRGQSAFARLIPAVASAGSREKTPSYSAIALRLSPGFSVSWELAGELCE